MKRLVYSPEAHAWVKTDTGVFDLSPYITNIAINRKVNQVSTAEVTFRNPKVDFGDGQPRFLFTQHTNSKGQVGPMFHPMDPIIISLTRIKGYPVQVFTGYCDKVPYFQMYPGVAKLTASCTLKRLQYTYWDPGLPFVTEYLASKGWALQNGVAINANAEANVDDNLLNDSSIGYLLFEVLKDIGGWNENDIFIQTLPNKEITSIVEGLFEDLTGEAKASFEVMKDFLKKTISSNNNLGGDGGTVGGGSNTTTTDIGEVTETNIVTKDNFTGSGISWTYQGKGSTYGSSRKYNYTDPNDDSYGSQKPASGADPDVPGFAILRSPIGRKPNYDWYVVVSPSGRAAALPQTDIGPAASTGRVVDINTSAAIGVFGYRQSGNKVNFPTDVGTWKLYHAGRGSSGRKKAEDLVKAG